MMTRIIEDLPPELRERIFLFLKVCDLKHIACCSKEYYGFVQHLIWRDLFLTWKFLNRHCMDMPSNLKYTNGLSFSYGWSPHTEVPSWDQISSNYTRVLKNCSDNQLKQLSIEGDIPDKALQITVENLPNLQELTLYLIQNNSYNGWKSLTNLHCLRKLSIHHCRIDDGSINAIIKIPKLRWLQLKACKGFRDKSLKYISSMTQLQKITLSHNRDVTNNGMVYFSKLTNLVELDLKYTDLNDSVLEKFCTCLKNLKTLDISECQNITDSGLYNLPRLKMLRNLNISGCTQVTDPGLTLVSTLGGLVEINIQFNHFSDEAIEEFCRKTHMKQKMKCFKFILTKNSRYWLQNGKCGLGWKCNCPCSEK